MATKKKKKENSERWLLTYSDLITLLMIFFVIMYSMSNVDSKKYDSLATSLNTSLSPSFSIVPGGSNNYVGSGVSANNGNSQFLSNSHPNETLSPTQEIEQQLKNYLETHDLTSQVNLHIEPQGLILSLNENIFFESGKAEVQPDYQKNLLEISEILNTFDNNVLIEGHTDNVPISNSHFKSNWELAAIRATNVVQLLIDEGHMEPSKLSATSYGEYRPIASNDTPEGRSKNRRIDIVLLSSTFYEESNASTVLESSRQD